MIKEAEFQKAFSKYLRTLDTPFHWKCIFFDMDGVLFDSMPYHATAWLKTFEEEGLKINPDEPYLNEGSTALYTARKMFRKYRNQEVGPEIAEKIKLRKHEIMATLPTANIMPHMPELLQETTNHGIDNWVVTGSGQAILLDRIEKEFNGSLHRHKMITAHDVKVGKPHPEPYLQAMLKSGYSQSEALVVENAPLGIESAKAAGLFTIAINTGPLDADVLYHSGADIVFDSSFELFENFETLLRIVKSYSYDSAQITEWHQ